MTSRVKKQEHDKRYDTYPKLYSKDVRQMKTQRR